LHYSILFIRYLNCRQRDTEGLIPLRKNCM